jgi:two-component system, chemotaxis family, CheB/CheR fusion protein
LRNTHTVVQSLVDLTLREVGVHPDVANTLSERLQALSQTHLLVIQDEGGTADLTTLARKQLGPYVGQDSRLQLDGPAVKLSRDDALPVGMLLHELATNSVKYGALSVPAGRVSLIWETIQNEQAKRVRIVWQEHGGPPVTQPRKLGLGSILIEGFENGKVNRDFRGEGVLCTIELPLTGDAG